METAPVDVLNWAHWRQAFPRTEVVRARPYACAPWCQIDDANRARNTPFLVNDGVAKIKLMSDWYPIAAMADGSCGACHGAGHCSRCRGEGVIQHADCEL